MILENSSLRVEIDERTGCFDVTQRGVDQPWRRDPWEQSPGELVLAPRGGGAPLTLALEQARKIAVTGGGTAATLTFADFRTAKGDAVPGASVRIGFTLEPNAAELVIDILDVSCDAATHEFESLLYPKRQFSLNTDRDEGYMALPFNQGALVPSGRFKVPLRDDWYKFDDLSWESSGVAWGTEGALGEIFVYGWNALSMPFFGARRRQSAWVGVMESDVDIKLSFILNNSFQDEYNRRAAKSPYERILTASPRWLGQKGAFAYPRRLRYGFFVEGSYVEMAKFYRKVAERQGLLVKLVDKLKRKPELAKMFGAPLINIDGGYPWYTDYESMMFTWNDLSRMVGDFRDELKIDRALLCIWGGYSKLPPDTLPFHPQWGTEAEMKAVMARVRDAGYLYSTYHGYPANLPHAESFDIEEATRNKDGGIGGRWGARCSCVFHRYAQRDLPQIQALTGQTVDYTDMLTSGTFRECYHPAHPLTRREDRKNRCGIFDYVTSLGMLTGSEVAQGYLVQHADYTKGGMYVGKKFFLLNLIHIPLYNLVFHDCIVTYDGTIGTSRRNEYSTETLESLAYGVLPVFSFNTAHYEGAKEVMRETHALLSNFLRETATAELVDHEYLGGGYDVQHTRFSTGHEVFINTDTADFRLADGRTVPAYGYCIVHAGKEVDRGQIQRHARRLKA
jgi:hypothetical protein